MYTTVNPLRTLWWYTQVNTSQDPKVVYPGMYGVYGGVYQGMYGVCTVVYIRVCLPEGMRKGQ